MINVKTIGVAVVGAAAIGLSVGSMAPAEAASVFIDETTFLSNVQSGSYLETFDSLPLGFNSSPQFFSKDEFSYTASTTGGFFNVRSGADTWLSTNGVNQPIAFEFTSGNISAVGGAFFTTNLGGAVTPGSITLALSDGTMQTLTNTNNNSFIGFIADPGTFFTSLNVSPGASTFATVNNFRVGTAVPSTPIPTPALLPGLLGMGIAAWRKRKNEEVEQVAETAEV